MAFPGGLLGGGSDPMDIYGDLFTEKQRAALRDQQMTQGLLNAAAVFSKAGQASRLPVSIPWGEAAQALGGSGDEAMNRMLKGMQVAEEVRTSRQQREVLSKAAPYVEALMKRFGLDFQTATKVATQITAAPATPAAPGAGLPPDIANIAGPAAWPAAKARPSAPQGYSPAAAGALGVPSQDVSRWGLPPRPGRTAQIDEYGNPPPPGYVFAPDGTMRAIPNPPEQQEGLLGTPPTAPQGEGLLAGLPPFGPDNQGSPDLSNIQIEQLSGEAAPAGSRPAPGDRSDAAWEYYKPIIKKLESGNRNIEQQVVPRGGGYNPSTGTVTGWSSASSPLQMLDSTFQGTGRKAGIDVSQYPRAMNAPEAIQDEVGKALFKERGLQPWAAYNAPLARATGYDGPMANAGSGFSGRIEQLGSDAAPAGGGEIPGLGVRPEALAALNAMLKMGGIKSDPFGSLLETYYKSPGYLGEAARTEAEARKQIERKYDPIIEAQKTRERLKAETELRPRLEAEIERAKNDPKLAYDEKKAIIDRKTDELKALGTASTTSKEVVVEVPGRAPEKRTLTNEQILRLNSGLGLPELELPREARLSEPFLTPEQQAAQTQRGKTSQEMREVEVWTPAGKVTQMMSNQEIETRRKLAADRGVAGPPQIGDIIDKPVMNQADQKIADALGEDFIALRRQAIASDKTIRDTHNLRSKLDSGMFTGLDANINLFLARLGDTMGWKNLSDAEKVKNTQTYIAGLGSEVLSMVKDLKPASNIDLQFASQMAGGQNLSAASIRQLLDMREEYARLAIQRHNDEAAGRNPAIFQGARRELPMPPAYQPKELTTPGGNKAIINR